MGGTRLLHHALAVVTSLSMALAMMSGCTDPVKKMQEAQKRLDAERKAFEEAALAKRKASEPKVAPAQLDAFWAAPSYAQIATGRRCPEGLWALFPQTPGEGASQEANEARRPQLAQEARNATYVTIFHHGTGVTLHQSKSNKKTLMVEVEGLVECVDDLGVLSLAWGKPARPFRPSGDEDDDEMEEALSPQSVWRARPLMFRLPFESPQEAKRFREGEGLGLDARLVYRLGQVDVDEYKVSTKRQGPEGQPTSENLDWGAGRLVRVELLGVRLGSDHERTLLLEKKTE